MIDMANVAWRSVSDGNGGLLWFSRELPGVRSRFRIAKLPDGRWGTSHWTGVDYRLFAPKADGNFSFRSVEAAKAAFN